VKTALTIVLCVAVLIIIVCVIFPIVAHKLAIRREKLGVKRKQSEQEQARTDEALQRYHEDLQQILGDTRWVGKRQYTAPDEDETTVSAESTSPLAMPERPAVTSVDDDKQDHE
jgi:uncharacterized membrane protein YhiD involved in acid resistance